MVHAFEVPDASCLAAVPPDEARLRSFNLDQQVRERTAGKGYTAAPHWSLCAECAESCSSRERLAVDTNEGTVRHERCR